jgi:glycosyltransferase involved in cell wall biosynthesis
MTSGAAPPSSPRPITLTVVRGTHTVDLPELSIYANLAQHGFAPELLAARKTNFEDHEVAMPVRRLATPPISGPVSRTMAGGYVIGRISPYRYMHEYLRGFDKAVAGSDILFPADLGHPTSFQCLKHRPRAKVVVQCWDNIPFNWPEDRPLSKHYRAVLEQADFFFPFSKFADRCLRLEGVGADRRAQVYCGMDLEAFRPPAPAERDAARQAMGARNDEVVVTYVGRVAFHKGIFTILEALPDADRRVRLHVLGSGPGKRAAAARAKNLGVLDRVKFYGWVPHHEIQAKVLWGTDIAVLPSVPTEQWRDQFPEVVMEFMATGLPLVASKTGGIPEEVDDGVTGILCTPDYPMEFTDALNRLAADLPLRQKMGRAARARAETMLDAKKNARELAAILKTRVLGL